MFLLPLRTSYRCPPAERLLVAGVENRVDHDRRKKDHALNDVLDGVLDVHDRHAVEQDADQQGANNDVADAAFAAERPMPPRTTTRITS